MTGRMIAGDWITTPARVYEVYTPRHEYVPQEVWALVGPLAVAACEAAQHSSVDAALAAIRTAAQFLAWCHQQELPLQAERAFLPDHVERFIATQTTHMTRACGDESGSVAEIRPGVCAGHADGWTADAH